MASIYEPSDRNLLLARIDRLTPQNKANWGKMNVLEMLAHGVKSESMMQGDMVIKPVFIGKIIGKMILNKILKDDAPFGKNSPTSAHLKSIGHTGDFEAERENWKAAISRYAAFDKPGIVHPFFGKMDRDQIGRFAHKHINHHLQQFGV